MAKTPVGYTTATNDAATAGDVALILIDVQNAFFHSGGENFYPQTGEIVPQLHALLAAARAGAKLVVHVADVHRLGLSDFESNKLPAHGRQGTFDSQYFEGFGPPAGGDTREIALVKRRFSAFFNTDLDLLLRENGIRRLVVAGVKTNVCVRATIQDGFGLGYRCLLVEDATNSNRANLADASREDIRRYMGWLVDTASACQVLV